MKAVLLFLSLAASGPASGLAQDAAQPPAVEPAAAPRGALFVSLDLSDLSPGSGGDRAAVDWVGPSGGRPTWFAGLATS
ncbi:MAG TPA: hypothetical protein VGG06_32335, partial [Thermoanaerobaculia bacterium]